VSRSSSEFRALSLGLQQVLLVQGEEYQPGDQVVVRELAPRDGDRYGSAHTSLWLCRRVTHRLTAADCSGIAPGWAVLSFNTAVENEWSTAAIQRRQRAFLRGTATMDDFWRSFELEEGRRLAELVRQSARPQLEKSAEVKTA
jgi:hypothetical protein